MTTSQHPIHSGFHAGTTALQVIDGVSLNGKVAIVTGGHSGIGLETTRALVAAGASVVVAARSPENARKALAKLPKVEVAELDLLDPQSIASFSERFVSGGRALHLLVNNAGIMATPLMRDARGYELQFSANHLGHFQLTTQLWRALQRANGARVISVSSRGHHLGNVDFDDPNFVQRDYNKWKSYGQSKTANILFALALDKRGSKRAIRAFSLHPGRIMSTGLIRYLGDEDLRAMGVLDEHNRPTAAAAGKTVEQGAATSVWCAVSSQLDGAGGVYCEDVDIARVATDETGSNSGVNRWAIDPVSADRLWALSEKLTGTRLSG